MIHQYNDFAILLAAFLGLALFFFAIAAITRIISKVAIKTYYEIKEKKEKLCVNQQKKDEQQ